MRCKWYNEVKGICTNARCAFFNSTCGLGTKQDVCKYAENEPWPVPPKLSIEELVKALRVCTAINNCSEKCPLYDYGDAAVCESAMKQQAANMLETIATYNPAKWISVKDRKPRIGQQVVAFQYGPNGYYSSTVFTHITSDGTWAYVCNDDAITHWIPLPAMPKKEKNHD